MRSSSAVDPPVTRAAATARWTAAGAGLGGVGWRGSSGAAILVATPRGTARNLGVEGKLPRAHGTLQGQPLERMHFRGCQTGAERWELRTSGSPDRVEQGEVLACVHRCERFELPVSAVRERARGGGRPVSRGGARREGFRGSYRSTAHGWHVTAVHPVEGRRRSGDFEPFLHRWLCGLTA